MQDWSEQYQTILSNSGRTPHLLAGYVDDGRQGTSTLQLGMRYDKKENKFVYSGDGEQEDINRGEQ